MQDMRKETICQGWKENFRKLKPFQSVEHGARLGKPTGTRERSQTVSLDP